MTVFSGEIDLCVEGALRQELSEYDNMIGDMIKYKAALRWTMPTVAGVSALRCTAPDVAQKAE